MKKILFVLLVVLGLSLFGCNEKKDYNIGIVQIVNHQSLNEIRDSIKEELNRKGFTDENTNFFFDEASNDVIILNQIIEKYKSFDLVFAIATKTAQVALKIADKTNVVFSAVSAPILAGITTNLESPDKNMTGTSDEIQVDLILDKALEINPNLKKLGVIYNPSEDNSVANINKVKKYAKANDIEIKEIVVSSVTEIEANIQAITTKLDAIFAPNDNTIATDGAMKKLSQICLDKKIPLYVGADSMVKTGGFLTIGINYTNLGIETAKLGIALLNGKKTSELPIVVMKENLDTVVNKSYMQALGIESIKNAIYVGDINA